MKLKLSAVFYLALFLITQPLWATWMQVGESLNLDTSKDAQNVSVAFVNSLPYVAWCEKALSDGRLALNVKYWNGSSWELRGVGRLNISPITQAYYPVLAVYNATPYVVWNENPNIYVKHWNGSGWQQDGGPVNGANTQLQPPGFAFSGSMPYVTYVERQGVHDQVLVKYWNGTAWQQLGSNLNFDVNKDASSPSLTVATNGTLYVTYYDTDYGFIVKHWSGSTWVQDGITIPGASLGTILSSAMISNTPYVIFKQWNGTNDVLYMKSQSGATWVDNGYLNNNFNKHMECSALNVVNNTPYVTWQEKNNSSIFQTFVKHWNGSTWLSDGTSLNINTSQNSDFSGIKNLDIKNVNDVIYLAFCESNGSNSQVYVKRTVLDRIATVEPSYGVNGQVTQVKISGGGFAPPPTARLVRSGQPDRVSTGAAQNTQFAYTYTFDLAGAVPGAYDVQVTTSDGYTSTLKQAFTVLAPLTGTVVWSVADIGAASSTTVTGVYTGLTIGDADQDQAQELYIANQDTSLYQIKKFSYGWSAPQALVAPVAKFQRAVLADGDGDQAWELYGLAQDLHVYQYKKSSVWARTDLGTGPLGATSVFGLGQADTDHDGRLELYVSGDTGAVCQYANTGTGWCQVTLPGPGSQAHALTTGDGDNDHVPEVYTANEDQKVYQFKYNGTSWQRVSLTGASTMGQGSMNHVTVGDGDNNGAQEVYAACQDGKVYMSRWNGSAWTAPQIVGTSAGSFLQSVVVSDADNDGQNEVLTAGGDGHVYAYKKTAFGWTTMDLGQTGTTLCALAVGDGDNDGQFEVYALGKNNHVYQFKSSAAPTPTPTATPLVTPTPTPGVTFTITPFSTDKFLKVYRSKINPNRGEQALIRWAQPQTAPITITIYNLVGDRISTLVDHQTYPAGQFNQVEWNGHTSSGETVGSGIYIVHIKTDGYETYSKIAIVK